MYMYIYIYGHMYEMSKQKCLTHTYVTTSHVHLATDQGLDVVHTLRHKVTFRGRQDPFDAHGAAAATLQHWCGLDPPEVTLLRNFGWF